MPARPEVANSAPSYRQGAIQDYHADELPAWQPRRRGGGDGTYRGSNVELGTPETIADDLREKLLEMDELLAFAAETNRRYRAAKTSRILMEAELLRRCPTKWITAGMGEDGDPLEIKLTSAASREQWLSVQAAEVIAEEYDCRIAWELVCKAANVQQAQLDGIRSIGARLGQQVGNAGREEFDGYTRAGRRMPGH